MKQRILSMVLSVCFIIGLIPSTAYASSTSSTDLPFTDVSEANWFTEAVQYVWEHNIMNGTSATKFSPEDPTTRAAVVSVLYRIDGATTTYKSSFTDVPSGQWYSEPISWASSNSIVNGYGNGKFGPNDKVTREQLATIIYRYLEFKGRDVGINPSNTNTSNLNTFSDANQVSEYAITAMTWAVGQGLIQGSNNKLNPQDGATRAELATILMRLCENILSQKPEDTEGSKDTEAGKDTEATKPENTEENKGTTPTRPSNPGTPSNPSNPGTPSTPSNPGNPSNPGTPVTPNIPVITPSTPTYENIEQEELKLTDLNNGDFPEIYVDDNTVPNFILGTYSDKKVTDIESAIDSLKDVQNLLQARNPELEFEGISSENMSLNGEANYYRLQQVYGGIPVFGKQMVVTADGTGTVQALSGHYIPSLNLSIAPTITEAEAGQITKQSSNTESWSSEGLIIYITEDSTGATESEATLSWLIHADEADYVIDATTGEIVNILPTVLDNDQFTGEGTSGLGASITFPVDKQEDGYYLFDTTRNIKVANMAWKANAEGDWEGDYTHIVNTSTNTAEEWNQNTAAITTYTNMIKVYDFYKNQLGRKGADNRNRQTRIVVNFENEYNEPLNNAYYTRGEGYEEIEGTPVVFIGLGNVVNFADALDVLAHEFTHAVSYSIWKPIYSGESGALSEAYSDIIGDLIEDGYYSGQTLYEHGEDLDDGPSRNFVTPEAHNQPSHYNNLVQCTRSGIHGSGKNTHKCDNNYVHTNSGIINHAAYLMDTNWPTQNHSVELVALFYQSMQQLTPCSSFNDCRNAVLSAAKLMGLSREKITIITNAFDDVGVTGGNAKEAGAGWHHIIGTVIDANTGSPIYNVKVEATRVDSAETTGTVYSEEDGSFNITVRVGDYYVSASKDGYETAALTDENGELKIINLNALDSWTVDIGTISLTPVTIITTGIAGTITSTFDSSKLEGVQIKFRPGADNTDGDYVKDEDNQEVYLVTNSTGGYASYLSDGTYTMEVSKGGYITVYQNVTIANGIVTADANLSPTLQGTITADEGGLIGEDIIVHAKKDDLRIEAIYSEDNYAILLEPGTYTIYASDQINLSFLDSTVNITGEETTPIILDIDLTVNIPEKPDPEEPEEPEQQYLTGGIYNMGWQFDKWISTTATITLTDKNGDTQVSEDQSSFKFEVEAGDTYQLTFQGTLYLTGISITVEIPADYDYSNVFNIACRTSVVAGWITEDKYRDKFEKGLIIYDENNYELIP